MAEEKTPVVGLPPSRYRHTLRIETYERIRLMTGTFWIIRDGGDYQAGDTIVLVDRVGAANISGNLFVPNPYNDKAVLAGVITHVCYNDPAVKRGRVVLSMRLGPVVEDEPGASFVKEGDES